MIGGLHRMWQRIKAWGYSGFGRDRWQQPERVIEALHLTRGARVADIGSGGGYFTFRFADAVGPDGVVYAVDTDAGLLRELATDARSRGLENVVTVPAEPGLPMLPEPVDLAFCSNSYHHLPDHQRYFAALGAFLRPGGRVAVLESRGEGLLGRIFGHATRPAVIRREMAEAGYTLQIEHEFLRRQGFLVFTR